MGWSAIGFLRHGNKVQGEWECCGVNDCSRNITMIEEKYLNGRYDH
jgi:hypothetical protein